MTSRLLRLSVVLGAVLVLAGCGTPHSFISVEQLLKESSDIKASADAGSTKGAAQKIASSATLSNVTASASTSGASVAGDILIRAGKAMNDPTTVQVIGAGVSAGASAAGMDDPSKTGVMAQAAAGIGGGLLVAIGYGINAWANRKKTTVPTPPAS